MSQKNNAERILWCIHGNLQQPAVWEPLLLPLRQREPQVQIQRVNLWETLTDDVWAWAGHFCATVHSFSSPNTVHYLLGYSLGGRLGFHGLIQQPDLWSSAIIVSADPGTADGATRELCLDRDRIWANRFLTEPWTELLTEWDALPVFCDRPCLTPRPERHFNRQQIARAFECYSKGHMDDLVPYLQSLSIPITYITGADDRRYCQLGQTLEAQCPSLNHVQISDAGHRVPWEQPDAFLKVLTNVLFPLP